MWFVIYAEDRESIWNPKARKRSKRFVMSRNAETFADTAQKEGWETAVVCLPDPRDALELLLGVFDDS